jgi:hypothetical protein
MIELFLLLPKFFFIIAQKYYGCGLKKINHSMDHDLISTINLIIEIF